MHDKRSERALSSARASCLCVHACSSAKGDVSLSACVLLVDGDVSLRARSHCGKAACPACALHVRSGVSLRARSLGEGGVSWCARSLGEGGVSVRARSLREGGVSMRAHSLRGGGVSSLACALIARRRRIDASARALNLWVQACSSAMATCLYVRAPIVGRRRVLRARSM